MSRSGSRGAPSDTACRRLEAAHVADFAKPLFRSERQNPRNVFEHVGFDDGKENELGPKLETRCFEQPPERSTSRTGLARLDPGDDRLRGTRASGQLALGETCPGPGLANQQSGIQTNRHNTMIAN